ncbi:MAG TPA: xanthine dehydrogenase family protein molybdopterin-binding subunit [Burkholderiales bacterium]|nr:xanthine dehydrogenase family protein molybdopterin-binding subunit [Burkholderiales bacterium]
MGQFGIGQSVTRFEDPRLLRGEGRFIHDVVLPGQLYAVIVRSPHAHAKIVSIDAKAAAAAPGVAAVWTGEDFAREGFGLPAPALKRTRPDGSPMFARAHPGLVTGRVRHVGDPVAVVLAETLALAKDAAELLEIEYQDLPSVTSTAEAVKPGAPRVWDENPDNVSNVFELGNKAATDAAFAKAAHVVKRRYVITRVHAQYMETRGAVAVYEPAEEKYTLYTDVQYPHRMRQFLAGTVFRIPESRLHVIAGDIGGAFGAKGPQYPEHRILMWAAKKARRPVRWACERSEAVLADEHARDNVSEIELALDADGKFLALRVNTLAALGAYVSSDRNLLSTFQSVSTVVGTYTITAAHVRITGVMTNTNSTAPYRGAGRPEATYLIERIIDDAARELGLDRVELRRRNLIPPDAFPWKTPLAYTYDCGEFARGMDKALALADVAGFAGRKDESKRRGRLRGLGIVNAIERASSPGLEYAEVRFHPGGTATLAMGSKNQGQGHETSLRQILNERLGIDPKDVAYVDGDTEKVAFGVGTMGSRTMAIAGTAIVIASDKIIAKGKKIAAHLMEAAEPDVVFDAGKFKVAGTDKAVTLKDVAKAAYEPDKLPKGLEPGLTESGMFSPENHTFPNGTHVCEVEIDPDTGVVEVQRYTVVDDVGTVVNPLTLKGQIHGGVVQGLSQVLFERIEYDPDNGQLLTGSFMDYAMPRADDVSNIEVGSNPVPTKLNPLGVKGAGEAGTVGALPAVMNAIMDALAQVGVKELDMPATADRVWRAIRGARGG